MMKSSPLVEASIDPIKFNIVVLPPPEGPLIMTNSPLKHKAETHNVNTLEYISVNLLTS